MAFEFISEGPKGKVPKIVMYSPTNLQGFYNLGFGDKDKATGLVRDDVVTNNNDSQKVLATVASTVYVFTDKHPDAWVFATGLNRARTRLYRMGLTNNLDEISQDFEVFGLERDEWVEFRKNTEYEAFLVRRKK